MIYRSNPDEILAYYENTNYLSQSYLKLFSESVFIANEETKKKSNSLNTGSAIDDLICIGEDYFYNNYIKSIEFKSDLSDKLKFICHQVFAELGDSIANEDLLLQVVYKVFNENSHYLNRKNENYKEDTRLKNFKDLKSNEIKYLEFLKTSQSKVILDPKDYDNVLSAYSEIINNKEISYYLKDNQYSDVYYQLALYDEIDEVKVKGLLDIVHINHDIELINLIDLKTTHEYPYMFHKSFGKYRYDLQQSFYKKLLSLKYPSYTIHCKILLVSKKIPKSPLLLNIDESALNVGEGGIKSTSTKIKGWRDCLDRYKWHLENNIWDQDMEYVINKNNTTIYYENGFEQRRL